MNESVKMQKEMIAVCGINCLACSVCLTKISLILVVECLKKFGAKKLQSRLKRDSVYSIKVM